MARTIEDDRLFDGIKWVMFARLLLLILAIGVFITNDVENIVFPPEPLSVYLTLITALVINLIYSLLIKQKLPLAPFLRVQTLIDIVITTFLIWQTRGVTSPFCFFYIPSILSTAVLLGRKEGMLVCFAILLLLSSHILYYSFDFLPQFSRDIDTLNFYHENYPRVFASLLSQATAFILIAILSSYLSFHLSEARIINDEMVEVMPDAIVVTDLKGKIAYCNEIFCMLAKIDRSQNLGKNLSQLPPPFSKLLPAMLNLQSPQQDIYNFNYGQDSVPHEVKTVPLKGVAGRVRGILFQLSSLAHYHEMQALQQKNQQLELVREISSGIAHEIRNPLAAMRGATVEVHENSDNDQHQSLLALVLKEMDRMEHTVDEFMNLTRMKSLQFHSHNLSAIIHMTTELLQNLPHTQKIRFSVNCNDNVEADIDEEQMQKVLFNLGKNAVEAMTDQGELTISVQSQNMVIQIDFIDTGKGISPEKLEKVFTPFFSTKTRGTGIGLSLVKRIVEEHGGEITASNNPGQGSCFSLKIPQRQYI